jgi:hypothetical protein
LIADRNGKGPADPENHFQVLDPAVALAIQVSLITPSQTDIHPLT